MYYTRVTLVQADRLVRDFDTRSLAWMLRLVFSENNVEMLLGGCARRMLGCQRRSAILADNIKRMTHTPATNSQQAGA